MKHISKNKKETGFALVEVLISITIVSVILIAFLLLLEHSRKVTRANIAELQATFYLRELVEAAKDLEVSNWDALTDGTCDIPCHMIITDDAWTPAAGIENIDVFTRSLTVENVMRDDPSIFPNEIVESGGEDDPNTKLLHAEITWNNGISDRTLELKTYVYRK